MDPASIRRFRSNLFRWYQRHERPLPWKDLDDPYLIWVSEIMLQQTRSDQAWDYFLRFTRAFPTVEDLARAEEDDVLSLWKGLGYYARARNLHSAARHLVETRGGELPEKYEDLLELKGVGPYTASAIASFAYGEARAVLDGNVHRVLSRFMGWGKTLDRAAHKRCFQKLADELIDPERAGTFNQAMMDLGAVICRPRKPLCNECPFEEECVARRETAWDLYPPSRKRPSRSSRFFHYLVCTDGEHVISWKRTGDDIWKGLYEFPLRETENNRWLSRKELEALREAQLNSMPAPDEQFRWSCFQKVYSQVLSHQNIHARFYLCQVDDLRPGKKASKAEVNSLRDRGLPRIIDCFLEDNYIYLNNLSI